MYSFKDMPRKNLPVYKAQINPDLNSELEVYFIGLVDRPAIEKNFQSFKHQKLTPAEGQRRLQAIFNSLPPKPSKGRQQRAMAAAINIIDNIYGKGFHKRLL